MHITVILVFTHLIAKLCKNKNRPCSFKATTDAAVNGKICSFCRVPELLGGIQQAGAPETATKSVAACFTFGE